MLPPDFAAFGFAMDRAGADGPLAERAAAACAAHGARHLLVVGAQRWGLLAELAGAGLGVTAVDPSRAVLAAARRGLAERGLEGRVTLFASDPRDVEVPGGAGAALLTSAMWRLLLHAEAQRSTLRSVRRALHAPALLLLDLDRAPPLRTGRSATLRRGPGRQTWTAVRHGDAVTVSCTSPGVAEIRVAMSAGSPEEAATALRAAGFDLLATENAATGRRMTVRAARAWIVARVAAAEGAGRTDGAVRARRRRTAGSTPGGVPAPQRNSPARERRPGAKRTVRRGTSR